MFEQIKKRKYRIFWHILTWINFIVLTYKLYSNIDFLTMYIHMNYSETKNVDIILEPTYKVMLVAVYLMLGLELMYFKNKVVRIIYAILTVPAVLVAFKFIEDYYLINSTLTICDKFYNPSLVPFRISILIFGIEVFSLLEEYRGDRKTKRPEPIDEAMGSEES